MNPLIQYKTITLPILIPLLLACFALFPSVQAAPDPPPIGGNNTRDGLNSLAHRTTGQFNSAFGTNALFSLTTGNNNAAQGNSAQFSLIDGDMNTAVGVLALRLNQHGVQNTAVGYSALLNTTASSSTAVGWKALANNTANGNTAVGSGALLSNTTAIANTATGTGALTSNTSGGFNTATGSAALLFNTIGEENTAIGAEALVLNIDGDENTAIGRWSLRDCTSGSLNTAVGSFALQICTGSGNTAVGRLAGVDLTNGSGNVCIGSGVFGVAGESNTTRIRNVYASVAATRAVYVTPSNKIGTLASSRRFKDEIKPMDKASEAILSLKPVTFRYKQQVDPDRVLMFGLVAEEVEKVNPDLVSRDEQGKAFTVRYEAVNAMLLNEFLKAHRKMEEQEATIVQLKQDFQSKFAEQQKQIKALTTGLEKVNNQLELSKPAPQMVANNR